MNEQKLDRWFDRELIPFVQRQLLEHPRFKGETVMFVVLTDNTPAPLSNVFALSLRDRLLQAAVETAGVNIGWRQDQGNTRSRNTAIDCTNDEAHYYIGLEITQRLDNSHIVRVRALDREDNSWVSGFGKTWRGTLSKAQRQAMQRALPDESFLGSRNVPFSFAQVDLLARHLAHELSCSLFGQRQGNYVVSTRHQPTTTISSNPVAADALQGTVELISNNLARLSAVELTTDQELANAELSGKAHQIDGGLFQYWLTITPNGEQGDLKLLSTSAYVLSPTPGLATSKSEPASPLASTQSRLKASQRTRQDLHAKIPLSVPIVAQEVLLGPLRLSTPSNREACGVAMQNPAHSAAYRSHTQQCSLLTTDTRADAIVFVIEHQPQLGLVRLGGNKCRQRTTARVIRAGDSLQYPIAYSQAGTGQSNETIDWLFEPRSDTYYAIAVADAKTARRLANHLDHLPMRCGTISRPGLRGKALNRWLDEFSMLATHSSQHLDWRALEIRDVL